MRLRRASASSASLALAASWLCTSSRNCESDRSASPLSTLPLLNREEVFAILITKRFLQDPSQWTEAIFGDIEAVNDWGENVVFVLPPILGIN